MLYGFVVVYGMPITLLVVIARRRVSGNHIFCVNTFTTPPWWRRLHAACLIVLEMYSSCLCAVVVVLYNTCELNSLSLSFVRIECLCLAFPDSTFILLLPVTIIAIVTIILICQQVILIVNFDRFSMFCISAWIVIACNCNRLFVVVVVMWVVVSIVVWSCKVVVF